jgi:hypothetical protein
VVLGVPLLPPQAHLYSIRLLEEEWIFREPPAVFFGAEEPWAEEGTPQECGTPSLAHSLSYLHYAPIVAMVAIPFAVVFALVEQL